MESGLNSRVGFKNVNFSFVFFNVFGLPQGLSVEDSEVDSGLNSGVGFKHIDF